MHRGLSRPNSTFTVRIGLAAVGLAVGLGLALATTGCNVYRPGGSLRSNDTFTYASTTFLPVTVSLVDSRTGETLWTSEVPVGKQLVVRFFRDQYKDNPANPDAMRWEIMDTGKWYGTLDNVIAVPAMGVRRLDTSLRAAPEYPPGAEQASAQ